jgi:hypothetical protein
MRRERPTRNDVEPPIDWTTEFPSEEEENVSREAVKRPAQEDSLSAFPDEGPRFWPLIDLRQPRRQARSERAPAMRTPAAMLGSLSARGGLPRGAIVVGVAVVAVAVSAGAFMGIRAGDEPDPDSTTVDSIAAPIAAPAAVQQPIGPPPNPFAAQPVTTETATTETARSTEPPGRDQREKPSAADRERAQPPAPVGADTTKRGSTPPPAHLALPVTRDPATLLAAPPVIVGAPPPAPTPAPVATPKPTPTPAPTATRDAAKEPAPPAPPTRAAETAAVQSVLDRYRRAFGMLNSIEVRTFWPNVNTKALDKAFEQLERQQFEFDSCRINLFGTRAEASCAGTATFVPRIGSRTPRVESRRWTFQLARENGAWIIEKVESR